MSAFKRAMRRMLPGLLGGLLLLGGLAHAGTVTYVYTDPQGTPLAEADQSGTITATFDYAPYGSQAMGTPPDGPGYTGHVNDPDTGLVYMQARYYDPAVGRFLSEDPVGPAAGNVFNVNRYAYANDNPIVNTDPTGRLICGSSGSSEGCYGTIDKPGGPCCSFAAGGRSKTASEQKQSPDDELTASINQLDVGNEAHRLLQTEARASSPLFIFTDKYSDGNGVTFGGGRPDIGNSFTKEIWEIKSLNGVTRGVIQLKFYSMASGGRYKPGGLPPGDGGTDPSYLHGGRPDG